MSRTFGNPNGRNQANRIDGDVQAGSERGRGESLSRLYRQHNRTLLNFLRARLGSEQEACDVAQEAYARMLQLDASQTIHFLTSYLFKIAANIATDRRRRQTVADRAEREFTERDPSTSAAVDVVLQAREELELIAKFIAELPPKCGEAFYLHRMEQLNPTAIAARLQVTPRMVHHYLVKALVHLRTRLDEVSATRQPGSPP